MNNRIGDNLVHFGANEMLVRGLVDAGVRLVVIGGLAVAWHCPEREADDMDLLVEPTTENSARIAGALAKLGLAGFSQDSFAGPNLQTRLKEVLYAELLTPQHDGSSFSEIEAAAVDASLFNIPVRLASVPTLIDMKRRAASSAEEQKEKHLRDLVLLERRAT